MGKFFERIDHAIELQASSFGDGKVTVAEGFHLVGAIVQAAASVVDGMEGNPAEFGELADDCEKVFDSYFAPLDLAGVPDWLEKGYVDPLLRSQLRPALQHVYEALKE